MKILKKNRLTPQFFENFQKFFTPPQFFGLWDTPAQSFIKHRIHLFVRKNSSNDQILINVKNFVMSTKHLLFEAMKKISFSI